MIHTIHTILYYGIMFGLIGAGINACCRELTGYPVLFRLAWFKRIIKFANTRTTRSLCIHNTSGYVEGMSGDKFACIYTEKYFGPVGPFNLPIEDIVTKRARGIVETDKQTIQMVCDTSNKEWSMLFHYPERVV